MTLVDGEVRVSVPATCANLGPGYDALGLALDIRDHVSACVADSLDITVEGEGADEVALDHTHLVYRSMARAFEELGVSPPPVRLRCRNRVPHGRGLGSSSAAIVAGIVAARALVAAGTSAMSDDDLFALAAQLEGHPDNVAPAVYGGFTIAYAEGASFRAAASAVDPRVRAVVFVPATPVETTVARSMLPETVSHRDAAANAGRAALLVEAVTRTPGLLFDATRDWLHQEYREPAMPQTLEVVHGLRRAGHAAVVSGAGPTVLVLCHDSEADRVVTHLPEGWRLHQPLVSRRGYVVHDLRDDAEDTLE